MAIIREAEIVITSIIENVGDKDIERSETKCIGYYNYAGDSLEITYAERTDGGEVTSIITRRGNEITVARHGAIESRMRFVTGETHESVYSIPPYAFDASVYTKRIRDSLDADGGELVLLYNMKIGGAEKAVRMKIWISTNSEQA